MNLATYVKRRNGVALGSNGSLSNMLKRSLGASSFTQFWQYWNPIWGYYLASYIFAPSKKHLPVWLATVFTFSVSGALHDLAIMLIKQQPSYLLTLWFTVMGVVVVVTKGLNLSWQQAPFIIRACFNLGLIVTSFLICKYLLLSF